MIALVALFVLILILVLWPSYWVRTVLRRHEAARPDLPGTGGELAEHLKKTLKLDVSVAMTDGGDHFDPTSQTVALSKGNFHGKHLTAVATAAHEIGHAIQWHTKDPQLMRRTELVSAAVWVARASQISLILIAVFHLIPGGVIIGRLFLIPVMLGMFFNTLVHLITLPVEWDASFSKALPLLISGEYIAETDVAAVKQILRACALTYVASAALSLLSFSNLIRIIRRG